METKFIAEYTDELRYCLVTQHAKAFKFPTFYTFGHYEFLEDLGFPNQNLCKLKNYTSLHLLLLLFTIAHEFESYILILRNLLVKFCGSVGCGSKTPTGFSGKERSKFQKKRMDEGKNLTKHCTESRVVKFFLPLALPLSPHSLFQPTSSPFLLRTLGVTSPINT